MSFKCVVIIHNKDVNGSLPVFACWSTYRGLAPKEEVLLIFHSAHCPPLHGPKSTLKMKHMPAQSACASKSMSIPTPNDYAMPAPKQKFPPIIHSTIYIYFLNHSYSTYFCKSKEHRSYVAPDHRIQQPVS